MTRVEERVYDQGRQAGSEVSDMEQIDPARK
jgi:hypothetical protein